MSGEVLKGKVALEHSDVEEFLRRKDCQNNELAIILERLQELKGKIHGPSDSSCADGGQIPKSGLLNKFSENADRTDSIISELYSVVDVLQRFI